MKKRDGFTLIELLAVVVILAVIALISTPLIMNIIDGAKKGALQNTAYGIMEAIKYTYTSEIIKDGSTNFAAFSYENGVESSSVANQVLNYKGTKPKSGSIVVDKEGNTAIAIYDGKYCAEKSFEDLEVTVSTKSESECQLTFASSMVVTSEVSVVEDGLVLSFDGTDFKNSPASTTWVDRSGHADATPMNFAYTTSSGSDNNGAIVFDGIDDLFTLKNPDIYSSSFTISLYVLFAEDNRDILFGDYQLVDNIGVNFEKSTSGRLRLWWGGSPDINTPNNVTPINEFCYVTVVFNKNNNTVKFYVNGVEVHKYSGALSSKTPTGQVQIGRDSRTGTTAMNGKIGNVHVYNRSLSQAEILQDYFSVK